MYILLCIYYYVYIYICIYIYIYIYIYIPPHYPGIYIYISQLFLLSKLYVATPQHNTTEIRIATEVGRPALQELLQWVLLLLGHLI